MATNQGITYQDDEAAVFDHNSEDTGTQVAVVDRSQPPAVRQEPQHPVPAVNDRPSPRDVLVEEDDDLGLVSEAINSLMRTGGRPREDVTVRTPVETRPAPQLPTAPGRIGQEQVQDVPVRHVQGILRELQETRRELQEIKRGQQPQPHQRAPQSDQDFETRFFSNPREVLNEVVQTFGQQLASVRLETDLELAQMRHGPDAFKTAFQAYMDAVGDGNNLPLYQRVMTAPSPGEEIVKWHRENTLVTETGGDLNAFRERLRAEIMQELGMAPANGQPGQPSPRQQAVQDAPRNPNGQFAPRHEVRLPTATSRMNGSPSGGNDDLEDGSDDAIFDAGRARPRR